MIRVPSLVKSSIGRRSHQPLMMTSSMTSSGSGAAAASSSRLDAGRGEMTVMLLHPSRNPSRYQSIPHLLSPPSSSPIHHHQHTNSLAPPNPP
eukprot:g15081.t1 g15081   contig21:503348-503822(-)